MPAGVFLFSDSSNNMSFKSILSYVGIAAGLILVGFAIWETQFEPQSKLSVFEREPQGIMGTSCKLIVVTDYRDKEKANKLLDKAEFQLRYIESLASNWIDESEISFFNHSEPGEYEFSNVNWDIIETARLAFDETSGAFDATCRPLIELWKNAGKTKQLPSADAILHARQLSSWNLLKLNRESKTVTKLATSACLDLGGIAKGYAIDAALMAMVDLGAQGALVEVGGDIRTFGTSVRRDQKWLLEIKNPHGEGILSSFELEGGLAVCTSGNYARYVEIEGKRYSHILNPTTGYPTEMVPSATVIAKTAMQSDVWATALSVLGDAALKILPEGVECQIITNTETDGEITHQTLHFPETH